MVSAKPRRRFARFLRAFIIVPLVLGVIVVAGFRFVSLRRESGQRTQLAPDTGRFVKAGDLEIFIQEAGPEDGPPVLMVHGTGAWSAIWRETMDALAAKGYRAIAIDVPPLDQSDRKRFADVSKHIIEMQEIVWVNPDIPDEKCLEWLEEGAPADDFRMLGYVKADEGD